MSEDKQYVALSGNDASFAISGMGTGTQTIEQTFPGSEYMKISPSSKYLFLGLPDNSINVYINCDFNYTNRDYFWDSSIS